MPLNCLDMHVKAAPNASAFAQHLADTCPLVVESAPTNDRRHTNFGPQILTPLPPKPASNPRVSRRSCPNSRSKQLLESPWVDIDATLVETAPSFHRTGGHYGMCSPSESATGTNAGTRIIWSEHHHPRSIRAVLGKSRSGTEPAQILGMHMSSLSNRSHCENPSKIRAKSLVGLGPQRSTSHQL